MSTHPFSVWAPAAERGVELLLGDDRLAMTPGAGGWWQLEAPAGTTAAGDTAYAFSIDGGEERPDPRARRMPDGIAGRSALFDPGEHIWRDDAWGGVTLEGSVIYELHVGTFTVAGTLDAALGRLDHLVDLGVDLVELLPLAPIPGVHGWGYDGVCLFAVHEAYGGPIALQRFVDACHGRGLGVCLDVVYNHLGPSGNHLGEFGPYFTDRYETPWGEALNLDGPGSDEVRHFVLDNAEQWLRDFHVDALRLDAVHELHDNRAIPLLETLSARVDRLAAEANRPLWLIAESDRNDPRTVQPRAARAGEVGGTGLHAQWADDVHHGLHVLLTGETQGYYADFDAPGTIDKVLTTPFFHDGTWSTFRGRHHGAPVPRGTTLGWRFVAALQTHDQVGNRAVGERLSALVSDGRLACGAALLLTSAYTPMLFMGEEWAASTPWQFFTDHQEPELAEAVSAGRAEEFAEHGWDEEEVADPQQLQTFRASVLDWDELGEARHDRVLWWYAALVALRRARPDLRDPRLELVGVDHDREAETVLVRRGQHRVVVNLSAQERVVMLDTDIGDLQVLLAWDRSASLSDGRLRVAPESACVLGPADTAGPQDDSASRAGP